jgi:hypothetical protein
MARRMAWKRFFGTYLGFPWFDESRRPRTLKACMALCDRAPRRDLERLPRWTTVFAPASGARDIVLRDFVPALPRRAPAVFIYFPPSLERRSQAQVDLAVAHGFARAICLEAKPKNTPHDPRERAEKASFAAFLGNSWEDEARRLMAKWGIAVRKSRRPANGARRTTARKEGTRS